MNKEEKKFTFEDWLEGKAFNMTNNQENALDMAVAVETGLMPKTELTKIIEKQEDAYDLLIEQHVDTKINGVDGIKWNMERASNPDEWLAIIKDELNQKIEPHRKAIARGVKNFHLITGSMYQKIMSGNKGWILFKNKSNTKKDGKPIVDELVWAWVNYKVLGWIEYEIQQADAENSESAINSISNEKETGSLRPTKWNSIYERMDKLTDEGHSALAASKIVEKEIKGVRKAGTIRNKYKGYL